MTLTLYGVELWAVGLMFARIGAMMMLLPGFGETAVPARIRLGFALAVAIAAAPALAGRMPEPAETVFGMAGQVIGEVVIGLLLGGAARLLVSALATAGQIIGTDMGLAFAQTVDPTQNQFGQLLGVFLGSLGMALIFATGLDHMFLRGVVGSYALIAPGAAPPTADAAELALGAVSSAFRVAFQIATPVVAAGLIFRIGMGALSRLIPQIQVYFVALPLQLMAGLVVLTLGLGSGMLLWLDSLERYAAWTG